LEPYYYRVAEMFLLTTSHRPSRRTRSFIKDLAGVLPSATILNRGKKPINEILSYAYLAGFTHVFIVHERAGNPSAIVLFRIIRENKPTYLPLGVIILKGVTLSRERRRTMRTGSHSISTINVEWNKCVTDKCFRLADLLLLVLKNYIASNPSMLVSLNEKSRFIEASFRNNRGIIEGPIIRVKEVRLNAWETDPPHG
jgi:U3 small nucleolar ribonucleoprotein protein IMP4